MIPDCDIAAPGSGSPTSGPHREAQAEPALLEDAGDQARRRNLGFIASVHDGPADLSTRTDEYLQRGFGRE